MSVYDGLIEKVFIADSSPKSDIEIYKFALKRGIAKKRDFAGKTPWKTIASKLYVRMRDDPNCPFIKVGRAPVKFTVKEGADLTIKPATMPAKDKTAQPELPELNNPTVSERDLHPLLAKLVRESRHFKAYSRSLNYEGNHWVYSGMVAVHFPYKEKDLVINSYEAQIKMAMKKDSLKIYSFELKTNLNLDNLRETYFKALSNSGWANEGYLVALNIDHSPEFTKALKALTDVFGIGLIQLNPLDITNSDIIVPAKYQDYINWGSVTSLIETYKEMGAFITDIVDSLNFGEIRGDYHKIGSYYDLKSYMLSKKIIPHL